MLIYRTTIRSTPRAGYRAQFYRWLVFMTNTLQTAMLRVLYPERYGGGDVGRFAAAEAESHFDLIDRDLDGRDWLVGEHRTAADLFLFMLTRWGRRLEHPSWNRPRIRAHFLRTLALPGVRRMIAERGSISPIGPHRRTSGKRVACARVQECRMSG